MREAGNLLPREDQPAEHSRVGLALLETRVVPSWEPPPRGQKVLGQPPEQPQQ